MRKPLPQKATIDQRRYGRWMNHFGAYREHVNRSTIEEWLSQFKKSDRDIAARVLDVVQFYGNDRIGVLFKKVLASLSGWHTDQHRRKKQWRFTALSGSAGESGDSMLHQFRIANDLSRTAYDRLFISRSEIVTQQLGADDTLVLVDDFSGTGRQACETWVKADTGFEELCAGIGRVYLIVVAASKIARQKIGKETAMCLVSGHELDESDNIFSRHCKHFKHAEKSRLLHYGKIADAKEPKGFGDCGFVVVFQHRCPNNTIPIFHASHRRWNGLFPR